MMQNYSLRPGDKVLLEEQKYFVAGMQNNGAYVRLTNGKAYSLKKARFSLSWKGRIYL